MYLLNLNLKNTRDTLIILVLFYLLINSEQLHEQEFHISTAYNMRTVR